jgi:signal transduction histidine kinase
LKVAVPGAAITLASVAFSYWPQSAPRAVWIAFTSYVVVLVFLRFARNSAPVRAAILLTALLLLAPLLFAAFGPGPAGFLCSLTGCVLAVALLSPRAAGGYFLVSAASMALGVWANARSLGLPHPDAPDSVFSDGWRWFRACLVWLPATGGLMYVTWWLTSHYDSVLRAMDKASALAVDEAARRTSSDVHDLRSALFVILGWNDLLSQPGVSESQARQGHEAIASAGQKAADLARRLLVMGREGMDSPPPARLFLPLRDGVHDEARMLLDDSRVIPPVQEIPDVSDAAGTDSAGCS